MYQRRTTIIVLVNLIANLHFIVQKVECINSNHYGNQILTNVNLRRREFIQRYKDALHISQTPKLKSRVTFDEEENSPFVDQWDELEDQRYMFTRKSKSSKSKAGSLEDERSNKTPQKTGRPVVYRYFGRNRARSVRAESIPFIVICTCVDHWEVVGRILASRGFNMIAVERPKRIEESNVDTSSKKTNDQITSHLAEDVNLNDEGEALVSSILDTLKWQKAILVGCDYESILALGAALQLPDRIAGLVMCGDLSTLFDHIHKEMKSLKLSEDDSFLDTEIFLEDFVDCPCQLLCDGDVINDYTSLIAKRLLGAGLVPHRRLPEQLSWLLTRFIEEKVSNNENEDFLKNDMMKPAIATNRTQQKQSYAPGLLLVSGRVFATILIYMSIAKVTVFQYKNMRNLQFDFSTILTLSKWNVAKKILTKLKEIEWKKRLPFYFLIQRFINFQSNVDITDEEDQFIRNSTDLRKDEDEMDKNDMKPEENNGQDTNEDEKIDQDAEKKGISSPLLQKLLFFDQIVS